MTHQEHEVLPRAVTDVIDGIAHTVSDAVRGLERMVGLEPAVAAPVQRPHYHYPIPEMPALTLLPATFVESATSRAVLSPRTQTEQEDRLLHRGRYAKELSRYIPPTSSDEFEVDETGREMFLGHTRAYWDAIYAEEEGDKTEQYFPEGHMDALRKFFHVGECEWHPLGKKLTAVNGHFRRFGRMGQKHALGLD